MATGRTRHNISFKDKDSCSPDGVLNYLMTIDSKFEKLKNILTELGALTATSPTYPSHEFNESVKLAKDLGVEQVVVDSNELLIPGFADNPPRRCYHCKKELFEICLLKAKELGYAEVLDGSNLDDLDDY
jgi:PP-loop superfamily ATP-utilizing enzyme